jgi:transcriptional regulator with XRE-family HTH domain
MTERSKDASRARRTAMREELYDRVKAADLDLVDAVRMMRKVAGKSQADYARLVGISPRALIDFERGVGNPTLETVQRMLEPFALELTVRRRRAEHGREADPLRERRVLKGPPEKVLPELRRRVARIGDDDRVEKFSIGRGPSPSSRAPAPGLRPAVVRLYVTSEARQASEVEAGLLRAVADHPKWAPDPGSTGPRTAGDHDRESRHVRTYVYLVAMAHRRQAPAADV